MKLRPEYESVCSSLLNRSPVPSLDICFGELLREEQHLSTQALLAQSHGSSGTATVAYAAQGRGPPMNSKNLQCFCCKEYGHIAANCPKKFCSYCKKKGHIITACRLRPQNRQAQAFQTVGYYPSRSDFCSTWLSFRCVLCSCTSCHELLHPRNGATDVNFGIISNGIPRS
ncbi:hypothetical protein F0562_028280 [Nyssa sinensis]|uniref:CCHC-type domain-containing protein n=1 Tax=Nyssa sinensis TaxID=561372 RepID=A0A5J5B9P7_9ASTE|nr:hypothetical protein F0562_028280 [Nyssa sinensis]